jgi:PQQ-dependent dehydrogenase (methanol/ethanol family)
MSNDFLPRGVCALAKAQCSWAKRGSLLTAAVLLSAAVAPAENPVIETSQIAQRELGSAIYGSKCASCHGQAREGGAAPALKGRIFNDKWEGLGIVALGNYIVQMMPPGASKPLDRVSAQAVGAFVLLRADAEIDAAPAKSKFADEVSRASLDRLRDLAGKISPVTDEMLRNSPNEDWLVWRGGVMARGYSPLKHIDHTNVSGLRLAWAKNIGHGANGITPLVHDGVIIIHGGGAIRAIEAATGDTIWSHEVKAVRGDLTQPRGVALYGNMVYAATIDKHALALDISTGKVIWDKQISGSGFFTAAPLVAKGLVFLGASGCLVRKATCFMVALNAKTGDEVWRFNTIPDGEIGRKSWGGALPEDRNGAGIWSPPSYDYDNDQIVFGTGNSYALDTLLRNGPGKVPTALYTNTTLKLDAKTGKLVWFYQHFPGDVWDEDWAFERTIFDDRRNGRKPTLLTIGKLGILDALDLKTGRYRWSLDLGLQDIVKSIDPKTGSKTIDWSKAPAAEGKSISACPYAGGVRNWPATSYDPTTNVLYVPILEACMEMLFDTTLPFKSSWNPKARSNSEGKFGRISAIDLRTGKEIWSEHRRAPIASALLTTGGGLLFEGSRDRWFRALDSRSGKLLWQTRINDTPSSFPITFSASGKQYVMVVSGGTPLDAVLSPLTPEIESSSNDTNLWVFALPDEH